MERNWPPTPGWTACAVQVVANHGELVSLHVPCIPGIWRSRCAMYCWMWVLCWCSSTLSDGSSLFTIIWFRAQWFEIYLFSIVFLYIFYSFPIVFICFPPSISGGARVPGLPPANLRNFQSFPGVWMRGQRSAFGMAFQNDIPTSEQMGSHSLGTYLCYIGNHEYGEWWIEVIRSRTSDVMKSFIRQSCFMVRKIPRTCWASFGFTG